MTRTMADADARDWSVKGNVADVIEEYLACYPDGLDEDGTFRLDPHEIRVLQRLGSSERAHVAINAIVSCAGGIWELADLCMDAERKMREFPVVLITERAMVERLASNRHSVKDLKRFIDQASKFSDYFAVDWIPIDDVEEANLRDALKRIEALIERREETVEFTMADRLKVTRKSGTISAAQTAALGDLAELVESTFGKPFRPQVAVLAEVAFGLDPGTVSPFRVREVLRTRRRKQDDPEVVRST